MKRLAGRLGGLWLMLGLVIACQAGGQPTGPGNVPLTPAGPPPAPASPAGRPASPPASPAASGPAGPASPPTPSPSPNPNPAARPAGSPALTPAPATGNADRPDLLIEVAGLVERLTDPNLRIIALTPKDDYDRGHLPGARQIDWPDLQVTDTADPSIEAWRRDVERKLGERGIAPGNSVVIYDGGTLYAARLWWILDQLGHREKRVLNGGLPAWQAAGQPIGTDPVTPPGVPYQGRPDASKLATLSQVRASLGRTDVVLVDARTPDEFAAGHLPGAINVNFPENARPTDPKFWKSADELRTLYRAQGITPDKTVIAYCSTGVRSAVTFFTLTLLGYPSVRLYTGSWEEWQSHPELPRATGP